MNFNDKKIINFSQGLINIFTDYAFTLDRYFKDEKNKKEHKELFEEYQVLHQNLKRLKEKYKL